MRGGLERWKRGGASEGVREAVAYAFDGGCDASNARASTGVVHAVGYGAAAVTRFVVTAGRVDVDTLEADALARWVDGADPVSGERRGRELRSPDADLLLDATMNMPKSFSLAVLLVPELRAEFDALQDRIRDRTLVLWQRELNARRGAGGAIRQDIARLEVVELRHERSRALDPHIHRHLWLGVKVLGTDGKWSNVDSRVAMKLHTVVNAEGDLASRGDPGWVGALGRHGFTLDDDGEISELAHLVRPLSRRSNQIEANRGLRLAQWRQEHPGQQPDHATLAWIDRWAWAQHRPPKPEEVDEAAWIDLVLDEIATLDPTAIQIRLPVEVEGRMIGELNRDLLAQTAIADADRRAAGSGGRFSRYDVRAGAIRSLAESGVVADRWLLDEVIEDLVNRALETTVDFLEDDAEVPAHVKHFMAVVTAQAKLDLAERFDQLNEPGQNVPEAAIADLAAEVVGDEVTLDGEQIRAAGAIGGTCRLVTVTGPAGTGKTTLLLVARRWLDEQGRRMLVVAPTRKAAIVAGRKIGSAASSLHALLLDHGFRFTQDATGPTLWTQLQPGDTDAKTGSLYRGPRRFPIQVGDRIVVDEAGMLDLHTANALAQLAHQTGARIAMIGDHLQAMPVGHSGAMAAMQRRSGSVIELAAVHRFRDPAYGPLTLRLREPTHHSDALIVAEELLEAGHVEMLTTEHEARERMVAAWLHHAARRERVALVTSTNAEAQHINDRIQQERLDRGQIAAAQVAIGRDRQRLLVGDLVQTRRNDSDLGVDNRALWTITQISSGGVRLASVSDSGDIRFIDHDYAADHIHLAYASTVHGIQGETVHASYVGPGVDAAGLYVGMTRGRSSNTALTIARDANQAIEKLADTMMRGQLEVTLEDGERAAGRELGRAARKPAAGEAVIASRRRAIVDRLRRLDEMRGATRGELRRLDARLATSAAAGHGRTASPSRVREEAALLAERLRLQDDAFGQRAEREALVARLREHSRAVIAHPPAYDPLRDRDPFGWHQDFAGGAVATEETDPPGL